MTNKIRQPTESFQNFQLFAEQDNFPEELKAMGKKKVLFALGALGTTTFGFSIYRFIYEYEQSMETKGRIINPVLVTLLTLLMRLALNMYSSFLKYVPMIIGSLTYLLILQSIIQISPHKFFFYDSLLMCPVINEYFHLIVLNSLSLKMFSNFVMYSSFLLRIYHHYKVLKLEIILIFAAQFLFSYFIQDLFKTYVEKISQLYTQKQQITNEIFMKTLETIPQGVLVLDSSKFDICFANQQLKDDLIVEDGGSLPVSISQLFLKRKYQINQGIENILISQQQQIRQQDQLQYVSFLKFLQNHDFLNSSQNELMIKRKFPVKQYFQVKAQFISQGSQIIAIFNNITRIKELESITYKMKSMFFSSIAHELRTPLNTIIPMTQRLQTMVNQEQCSQYIRIILNSSIHLQNVIEDALDMSRIENHKFEAILEVFNLRKVLEEISSVMSFQIEQKNLRFNLIISDRVPQSIKTDQKRYTQILFNLLGNAIKFTFEGHITVSMDCIDNKLKTSVEDSGIGIKDEDKDKLFRFFGSLQTSKKLNKGGMGLGLTISKLILQELQGNITMESEPNKGTTFSFYIPLEVNQQGLLQDDAVINPMIEIADLPKEERIIERQLSPQLNDTIFRLESEEDLLPDRFDRYLKNSSIIPSSHYRECEPTLEEESKEPQINGNQSKILLLIDDSSYNLFVIEELLKTISDNNEIDTAMNGYQAIEKVVLRSHSNQKYDIIFIDLNMPILDGFQTVESLIKMQAEGKVDIRSTRIIAVSAITLSQFRNYKNYLNFSEFIEKPISLGKLKDVLNSIP